MNPAGFTYAGFALKDCVKGAGLPYVEVHISNIANAASTASCRTWLRALSPALGCTPTFSVWTRCSRFCVRGRRNRGLEGALTEMSDWFHSLPSLGWRY